MAAYTGMGRRGFGQGQHGGQATQAYTGMGRNGMGQGQHQPGFTGMGRNGMGQGQHGGQAWQPPQAPPAPQSQPPMQPQGQGYPTPNMGQNFQNIAGQMGAQARPWNPMQNPNGGGLPGNAWPFPNAPHDLMLRYPPGQGPDLSAMQGGLNSIPQGAQRRSFGWGRGGSKPASPQGLMSLPPGAQVPPGMKQRSF